MDEDHHFIVGTKMSNSRSDQKQFDGVLQSVEDNMGQSPEKVTADAGYFSASNIECAEKHQTDSYIAATKEKNHPQNSTTKRISSIMQRQIHTLAPQEMIGSGENSARRE
ncbi:transposase [Bacillus sp. FSL W7-1360]